MRQLHDTGYTNFYLLGDSGYTLRPWLQTTVDDAQPGTPKDSYNECHRSTRATIERYNGLRKTRFRCLLKHPVSHYSSHRTSKIINACAVLHNLCIEYHLPNPPAFDNDEGDIEEEHAGHSMCPVILRNEIPSLL
ncbi:putative nuclease HARBI1 [Belonocnema kinseyi]|uniref:putative nuclease HARBI1 n=1 Tax=Belonocnema kinseyi TaxID=2817044 RepID=UPI00143D0E8F|nr:putative nuclease HARBI1 [Belonocnema kinseyi]XP_033226825.1 putative nuclease HARBI1 [Belonocnema kinseyi]XP_033226826.1 putative nuclease HARBI1 [Belonocnema kinseyi]